MATQARPHLPGRGHRGGAVGPTQWEHVASTYRALIGLDLEEPDSFETWIGQARALFANDEFRGVVFLHRYIALGRGAFDRAAADMERAAPSSGVLEDLESESSPLDIESRPRLDRITESARHALGDEPFERAVQAGRALSRDEAIVLLSADRVDEQPSR